MNYLELFSPDLQEFYEKTAAFSREEISVADYKGFSGGFGSYAQRGAQKHMLRLRMSGGRITLPTLKGIIDITERYGVDRIKLTTCESVQLHDLNADVLCRAILPAWEAGMITRGGGGDFPRNIMCAPLSGVERGEYFDVMPYALRMGEYLMSFIKGTKFPRKLKCSFTNSESNAVHATIRDLGFTANADGTFDVYICGGMGSNPKVGIKAAEHIAPEKIRFYAKAMVETFKAYGNYENRGRARTRYLQETLGTDGLLKAFHEKLAEAFHGEDLTLTEEETTGVARKFNDALLLKIERTGARAEDLTAYRDHRRVYIQKQEGLCAVFYQPIGGMVLPKTLAAIYEAIKDMDCVELRVTPDEGVYILNLTAAEAEKVLKLTADGARNLFETSTACVGARTCQVGVGDSQGLLRLCVEELRKHDYADGVLPQIHISGCPSSCTGHFTAAIGFRGGMRRVDGVMQPAFAIFVGGCDRKGAEKLAAPGKLILVNDIPKLLIDIAESVSEAGTTYDKWIVGNEAKLDEIIAKYAG